MIFKKINSELENVIKIIKYYKKKNFIFKQYKNAKKRKNNIKK